MVELKPLKIMPLKVTDAERVAQAFPEIDPQFRPLGHKLIVQLRSPVTFKNGIHLPDETVETEKWNTQIGRVRDIGPVAFRNRDTLKEWPEGAWCKIGDYVRVPKYNQDRWEIIHEAEEAMHLGYEKKRWVLFMLVSDIDLLGVKTGNPLDVKAYI